MPIRRIHPFCQKTHQTDQKSEERNSLRRKIASHLPAVWLFGALLWCGPFVSHGGGLFGIILGLSLYFWLTLLVGFFVLGFVPPRLWDIPDFVLVAVTVLLTFFPFDRPFFGWSWVVSSLLLAAMALENVVRAICGKGRRRAVWKAVFAAMTLLSLFLLNYIAASWASC